jgi:tetratricopeptide (TPR) repeat protein
VAALVDKNLLRVEDQAEGEPRLGMLETIREYAWERLAASGEAEEVRRRHAEYFVTLAEAAEPELRGPHQGEWAQRLETEHDNLRAALTWCSEQGAREVALRLGGALWRFWVSYGHVSEGRTWLEGLLRQGPAGGGEGALAAARAKALSGAGALAHAQGDYRRAMALHEEALALFRELGDKMGIALSLHELGDVARRHGDYGRAAAWHEESLALLRDLGENNWIGWALVSLGVIAFEQGDQERAAALAEEALALFRALGDNNGIAWALIGVGQVAHQRGDARRATALFAESLALFRGVGHKVGIGFALNDLGLATREQGDYERAAGLLEESVALFRELGNTRLGLEVRANLALVRHEQGDDERAGALWADVLTGSRTGGLPLCCVLLALEGTAGIAGARGQPERATRLLGAAEATRRRLGAPLAPNERPRYERLVAAVRTHLDDETFAAAWAAGRALSLEQAIAEATDCLLSSTGASHCAPR